MTLSAFTSYYECSLEQKAFFPTDSLIILIVVLINAVLGVLQESKAEKAIEALQKMSASTSKVLRDQKVVVLPSTQLVKGDVVSEVDVVTASGVFTSVITTRSVEELDLQIGSQVLVLIKSTDVSLAKL